MFSQQFCWFLRFKPFDVYVYMCLIKGYMVLPRNKAARHIGKQPGSAI